MDLRSEAQLATIAPELAARVRIAAEAVAREGTFLLVVSGLRTAAEQNALYAQGRTSPGHIVTNAKAGQSMHNYGLAVDVVPYLTGLGGQLNWKPETEQYQAMVKALKAQGLEWGGDWKRFPDDDHFQFTGLPANPTAAMVEAYDGGTALALTNIWKQAAAGAYSV